MSDNSARNQGYLDGWANGRADMLDAFEAIALHWERETGGGYERMREGARWLRTAIDKVKRDVPYDGCEHQGPDPWARIAELEAEVTYRREQIEQALDAISWTARLTGRKQFTKYRCECGAMVTNNGRGYDSHLRGTIHRQNMERTALGLDPI